MTVPAIPGGLPPLPVAGRFEEDRKYRGTTAAMDKVLDAVHRDGWSLEQLFREPLAVLPLPEGKFPPGRVYLFTENVAVVVESATGVVVASLPVRVALDTLHRYSPQVLAGDGWASQRWAETAAAGGGNGGAVPRWWKQTWIDGDGSVWVLRRSGGPGVRVFRDGTLVGSPADGDAAEGAGFHPVVVELVDFLAGS